MYKDFTADCQVDTVKLANKIIDEGFYYGISLVKANPPKEGENKRNWASRVRALAPRENHRQTLNSILTHGVITGELWQIFESAIEDGMEFAYARRISKATAKSENQISEF